MPILDWLDSDKDVKVADAVADLPRVGASGLFGLGGFDFALSHSHRYAMYIASNTLAKISKEKSKKILLGRVIN